MILINIIILLRSKQSVIINTFLPSKVNNTYEIMSKTYISNLKHHFWRVQPKHAHLLRRSENKLISKHLLPR